ENMRVSAFIASSNPSFSEKLIPVVRLLSALALCNTKPRRARLRAWVQTCAGIVCQHIEMAHGPLKPVQPILPQQIAWEFERRFKRLWPLGWVGYPQSPTSKTHRSV